MSDIEANNVSTTETRGGIKYELVLEQATSELPAKVLQSPARNISAAEIEGKLKAAEERRQSLQAQKLEELKEMDTKIFELRDKRTECENVFKEEVRQSLEKKMEISKENRENIIKSIQDKAREHERRISEVRQNKENQTTGDETNPTEDAQ